jgi:hypothetical protein
MLDEDEQPRQHCGADAGAEAREQNGAPKAQRTGTGQGRWNARIDLNLG